MDKKKMHISHWFVIALSIACMTAMVVLLALPEEWIAYVIIGGMVLFIGFFFVFNIFLLFLKIRRRRGEDEDSK